MEEQGEQGGPGEGRQKEGGAKVKEIRRMLEIKGKYGEDEEYEQERRSSFFRGVSVEAEYSFTNTVGKFTRQAVKEGSFKGKTIGNVKEQLLARTRLEEKGSRKKSTVVVGGSQIGRKAGEIGRIGGKVVGVHKVLKICTRGSDQGKAGESERRHVGG